jgi:hypothetical protein
MSLGPFSVAFLTDCVFADEKALPLGMAIVTGVAPAFAAIVLASACSHFRKCAQDQTI